MLEIYGLTKSYKRGATPAVDNLTLAVRPGEIFGFLGPNGAGKTTTIKMIVGLLNQDHGRVMVSGFDTRQKPLDAKTCIGFVPDNPELYDRLTGLEYLGFIADVFEVETSVRKERLQAYLTMFELESAVRDRIGSYSHGMKQKLALTAALLHNPDLLVLDEPMVGLDPRSAHLFKQVLREHCARGKAVFFSTHILEVAEHVCDRVGIIHHGRLIACGTIDDLRHGTGSQGESLESLFLELTGS